MALFIAWAFWGAAPGLLPRRGLSAPAAPRACRQRSCAPQAAAVARPRLLGLCLNDVGPEIHRPGIVRIFDYIGRNPAQKTYAEAAVFRARNWVNFRNGSNDRWLAVVHTICSGRHAPERSSPDRSASPMRPVPRIANWRMVWLVSVIGASLADGADAATTPPPLAGRRPCSPAARRCDA